MDVATQVDRIYDHNLETLSNCYQGRIIPSESSLHKEYLKLIAIKKKWRDSTFWHFFCVVSIFFKLFVEKLWLLIVSFKMKSRSAVFHGLWPRMQTMNWVR